MLAPFHNPIRLAEDVAVLDQMSGGRFILGMGTGWRDREFHSFGLNPKHRGIALEETVSVLRRAWTGERFDFEGRVYQFQDVLVRPPTFTPGGPPIWLGGTGPKALSRAGSLGDGHFGVGMPFDGAMATWRAAVEAVPAGGAEAFSFGQLRSGFIADDPDRAFALAARGMRYTLGVHAGWAAELSGGEAQKAPAVSDDELRAYNLLGSADDIVAGLSPYARAFPGRDDCHLSFRLYHPYTPREAVLAAIEAYGKDVAPRLRHLEQEARGTTPSG